MIIQLLFSRWYFFCSKKWSKKTQPSSGKPVCPYIGWPKLFRVTTRNAAIALKFKQSKWIACIKIDLLISLMNLARLPAIIWSSRQPNVLDIRPERMTKREKAVKQLKLLCFLSSFRSLLCAFLFWQWVNTWSFLLLLHFLCIFRTHNLQSMRILTVVGCQETPLPLRNWVFRYGANVGVAAGECVYSTYNWLKTRFDIELANFPRSKKSFTITAAVDVYLRRRMSLTLLKYQNEERQLLTH